MLLTMLNRFGAYEQINKLIDQHIGMWQLGEGYQGRPNRGQYSSFPYSLLTGSFITAKMKERCH